MAHSAANYKAYRYRVRPVRDIPLTRDHDETVEARLRIDPEYAVALYHEQRKQIEELAEMFAFQSAMKNERSPKAYVEKCDDGSFNVCFGMFQRKYVPAKYGKCIGPDCDKPNIRIAELEMRSGCCRDASTGKDLLIAEREKQVPKAVTPLNGKCPACGGWCGWSYCCHCGSKLNWSKDGDA